MNVYNIIDISELRCPTIILRALLVALVYTLAYTCLHDRGHSARRPSIRGFAISIAAGTGPTRYKVLDALDVIACLAVQHNNTMATTK